MIEEKPEEMRNINNDSDVKAIVTKYSIILGFAIAIILILFSTRERIETFNPEDFKEEIREVALLFITRELLGEHSKVQKLDLISFEFEEIELGEYSFYTGFSYTVDNSYHILLTEWKYSSINDNLDLISFSLDGSQRKFIDF